MSQRDQVHMECQQALKTAFDKSMIHCKELEVKFVCKVLIRGVHDLKSHMLAG